MDWFVRAFLKASLVWLTLGVTLGVAMALEPAWIVYRPAHVHMNLAGFVTMMIFGVAYHVVPRFTGRPLHDRMLAGRQWWASNAGLACMVAGFAVRVHDATAGSALLGLGAFLAAGGAYAFAYNLWRTIGPSVEVIVPVGGRAVGR